MKQNKKRNYTEAELVLNLSLDKIKLTHTFTEVVGKQYCTSESFNVTKKEELLQVIAILKKFREILITKLLR